MNQEPIAVKQYDLPGGRKIRTRRGNLIKDRGAPGRWQTVNRSRGIGPLKEGLLTRVGYRHTLKASTRHQALDKAVTTYGRNSTIRKLNAIATYAKRTGPSRAKIYKTDMHYVQKKY
jgi:hypothetical protein